MKYYFNPISKLCAKVNTLILSDKVYAKIKREKDYSAK